MPENIVGSAWVAIRPDLSGFDTALFAGVTEAIKKVQIFADAKPITLRVKLDTTQAVAQISALRAGVGGALGGSGGGGGFTAGALAGAAGSSGGGGALSGVITADALQRLVGVGAGSASHGAGNWFGGITTAGAFSVLAMAGLGLEHIIFTIVGLVGSLAGAFAGLGVLAVGVFGKMGVGMLSDATVMSSTIADTKTLYTALTAIQTAQITYGKNSAQAAAATANLNVQMALIGDTAGVKAELGLARAGQSLNTFWDKATATARVAAVGFIEPFLKVAYTYIPLINEAATRNFGLMTTAFKPFIDWADTQGTAIFQNLENMFAADIPIGVNALTQFLELLAKIANFAAPQTGSLLASIDKWLTNANTASGFDHLEGTLRTLIGMFHDWMALFVIAFKDIVDIFKLTAGLGTSIVGTLTQMLDQLHAWLTLTTTKSSLHNLFEIHKQEVLELLQLLPPLLEGLGNVYLTVAPLLTKALTLVLDGLVPVLKAITSNAWGAWFLGIGLILTKLGLLGSVFGIIKSGISGVLDIGSVAGQSPSKLADVLGLAGQRVFVTNWPPGFGSGIPGVSGAGADGVEGGVLGSLGAGASTLSEVAALAAPVAAAVVVLLGGIALLNAVSQHPNTSPTPGGPGTGGALKGVAGVQAAYAATWNALLDSSNAAYRNSALFQQNLQTDLKAAGVPLGQIPGDALLIAKDFADGKIKTKAQLEAIIAALAHTTVAAKGAQVSAANAKAEWNTLALLSKGGKDQWNEFFSQLGGELKNTLQSGSNVADAEDDLYALFKAGKVKNATQLKGWEDSWNDIQSSTGLNAVYAEGIATQMELAGKLTNAQVPAFITAFNTLVKEGMNPASITAVDIANELLLAAATTANLNQTLATINSAALIFSKTNRLSLPHSTTKGAAIIINQTNNHNGTNQSETTKAIKTNNAELIRALRAL